MEVNQAPQGNQPGENSTEATTPQQEKTTGSVGPMFGIVIIIALLIFGGLYFWGASLSGNGYDNLPLILGDRDSGGTSQTGGGNSTNPESIENDFNDTDVAGLEAQLEADLSDLENEF